MPKPKTDKPPAKPRNKWTQWFVQMMTVQTKGCGLEIIHEYELYKNPMKIDVVVVKKPANVVLKNTAMKFFRNHNIIEFKGPVDSLTIQGYDRVMSYFYAYLSQESLSFAEVAITFISVRKPLKLLDTLQKERNYKIICAKDAGIYYITAEGIPVTQLIVSKEAQAADLTWIRALRDDLSLKEGLEMIKKFGSEEDVVQSLLLANKTLLEELANMEVKDPKIRKLFEKMTGKSFVEVRMEGRQEGLQEGMQKGIQEVFTLLEKGYSLTEAKKKLQLV